MKTAKIRNVLKDMIDDADNRLLRILYVTAKEYNREEAESDQIKTEKGNHTLYRLVYTSSRDESCSDEDIEQILAASSRNNSGQDVTGLLIHTPKRFLQVLEGPYDVVQNLYEKIEKDPRHGGSTMRYCEPIESREFEGWYMAGKKMVSDEVEFLTELGENEKTLYQSFMDGDINNYSDDGMRVIKSFLMVS